MSIRRLVKDPKANLRSRYLKTLEICLLISVLLLSILFFAFQKFERSTHLTLSPKIDTFEFIDIPRTIQRKQPPPPSIPTIPNPVDDDAVAPDVTIDWGESIAMNADTPPPPSEFNEVEVFEFFAVSKKPKLKNYFVPDYPPLARKAGIEGNVVVKVLIDTKGNVEKAEIYTSVPMLDETALNAAMQLKYEPAMQRDRYVKVWAFVPYQFKFK